MTNHSFCEEINFDSQSKPSLVQSENVSSLLVPCHLRKEINIRLAATSYQVVVKRDKVIPQVFFLFFFSPD